MYKITNIETLGTDYTVATEAGKILGSLKIVPHAEIIDAAGGPYNDSLGSYASYITKAIALLEGNENIDPHSIWWYSTEDDDIPLGELIQTAVANKYTTIIIEQLEPTTD